MNEPLQISDKAREAAKQEIGSQNSRDFWTETLSTAPKQGHFVQQLLDSKQKEWENKFNKSIEDICCQNAESNIHYEKRIKELEIRLNEAQQWIDSEPDWKDKYMANYQQLQKEKEQETKIVTLYRSILSGCSVHGLWEGVSCIGCIEQERDQLRKQLAEAQAAIGVKDAALEEVALGGCEGPNETTCLQDDSGVSISDYCLPCRCQLALQPNCGQPLLEAVKEMKEALVWVKAMSSPNAPNVTWTQFIVRCEQALTKAKEIGL